MNLHFKMLFFMLGQCIPNVAHYVEIMNPIFVLELLLFSFQDLGLATRLSCERGRDSKRDQGKEHLHWRDVISIWCQ